MVYGRILRLRVEPHGLARGSRQFRAVKKNIQADPLDALQLIVDELKSQREKMNQLSEANAEVSARIDNVEKKIAGPDTGAKTPTEVARMSGFYSKNGNPHESFVKALLHRARGVKPLPLGMGR